MPLYKNCKKAIIIRDGLHNGIENSQIIGTGEGGVELYGGDRVTLTPGHNYAVNNVFDNYSRIKTVYTPALFKRCRKSSGP